MNKITPEDTIWIEFSIDADALIETPTKRISDIKVVIEYENPQAYSYPDVAHWEDEYGFDKFGIDELRRKINEQD